MTVSIARRLNGIKKLAKEYYNLEYGALIDKHSELHRVFDIRGSMHNDHPHKLMRVYISRRSLKHFVESRKKDLEKRHSPEETLASLCFAIDGIQETIKDFDLYEYEPPTRHFYIKDYSHLGKPFLRILVERKQERLEIISIHYKERKRK
jgi:hypothetical protein